jgi:hypothetical protein
MRDIDWSTPMHIPVNTIDLALRRAANPVRNDAERAAHEVLPASLDAARSARQPRRLVDRLRHH